MAEGESVKRQVAHKVRIADILNNKYVKEEGWLPNYVQVGDRKVSRANILGVVVSVNKTDAGPAQGFVLDDSTGRISLRFFENAPRVDVGDIVTVIGRLREFGAERYIVPEIMRKISDSTWIEVRKLELALHKHTTVASVAPDELSVEEEDFDGSNPVNSLIGIIRELDSGDGVGFDDISVKFKGDADEHIKHLLESGDIFEVKPGRYKILE